VPASTRGRVDAAPAYAPMSLADLGAHLAGASDDDHRWRLLAEFLEEFRWAPPGERLHLLSAAPPSTQDRRWDVLLAALAEHLAAREGRAAPAWADGKILEQFWFPFNTDAARVDAFVHAPAAFRSRGVVLAARELEVA
jgi:hypothetical protein